MTRASQNQIAPRAGLLFCLLLTSLACDQSGSSGSADPRAKPGLVTGKLADDRGGPLSNVTVRVAGFTRGGEPVNKEFKVAGPAREYSLEIPEGAYTAPEASISLDYNARSYTLPLIAGDGEKEWPRARDSKVGLVRDFVFKISGARPEGLGSDVDPSGYYGSAAIFELGGEFGDVASFEITLKPDGPLIDGSEGKPLMFVRKLPWRRQEDHYLLNIPTGRYIASAKLLYGTKPRPLKIICYAVDPENPDAAPERSGLTATLEFEMRKSKDGKLRLTMPSITVFP